AYPIADALSRLACRALLVWGGNDTVTPAAPWKRMARVMGGCTFRSVQRCGHSPMIERPRQFNRILVEFLAREETWPQAASDKPQAVSGCQMIVARFAFLRAEDCGPLAACGLR